MFGTLVIQLPSNYSGGQLIVYHQSKSKKFDFSGLAGCTNFHYAAFYADCQHEIQPVTKGHRLCLVYNLVCHRNTPSPTDNRRVVSTVVSAIRKWKSDDPPMMTYMLEHKYCESSLSFQSLKNTDRAVADVLTQVKSEVPYDLYLAQVNLVENWSATHYGCSYGCRGCCDDSGDYTADELCDETVTADNLQSIDGQTISSISLSKEYFVPEGFFDTIDPDNEEFEEATGNEGATLDKQYNWAALLLWPSKNRTLNLGTTNIIHLLEKELLHGSSQDKKTSEVVAKDLFRLLADDCAYSVRTEILVSFLRSLGILDNVGLISEFLEIIAKPAYRYHHSSLIACPTFGDQIVLFGSKYGWNVLKSSLQAMFDKLSCSDVEKYCKFLLKISQQQPSDARNDLCRALASNVVSVLANEEDKPQWTFYSYSPTCRDKGFVNLLFTCFTALGCINQLLSFVQVLRTKPNRYPIVGTLAPFCEDQYKSLKEEKKDSEASDQVLMYCISSLEASQTPAPSCPSDWSLPVPFSCSCVDCVELIRFMRHPTEIQHRFKMGKGRRRHLHCQLDGNQCSVTHVTEHIGNPHTLIVTKTRAAYDEGCERSKKEKATLSRLRALPGASSSNGEPSVKRQKVVDLTRK